MFPLSQRSDPKETETMTETTTRKLNHFAPGLGRFAYVTRIETSAGTTLEIHTGDRRSDFQAGWTRTPDGTWSEWQSPEEGRAIPSALVPECLRVLA